MNSPETKWYDAFEVKPPKKKFKITADHVNVAGIITGIILFTLWIILG